jgi:predicted O-linked N-acetylglucosamine transferase (SPINDLY family)
MDYRLTDRWADPVGKTENLHTEILVRLPSGFLCYSPINTVAVSPLPALGNTHSDGVESGEGRGVCFGSFNSFQKITDKMLDAWIEILNAVENSRFLLKSIAMQEDETREKTAKYFTDRGIERSRVELLGFTPEKEDHLALYGKVDIHLDTFPYNGTTTTCEALWQGVPTVSLAGDSHRARVGLSILNQVGLSDYIANSFSDYVALAIEKASDLKALSELREGLRERVSNSALTDVSLFATELSDAYEKMYEERVLSS